MARVPEPVAEFLSGRRFAVAGVSRDPGQPANAVYRKLRDAGYDVVAINPNASEVEGARCCPDLASVPGPIDGVVIVTPPDVSVAVVRQCAERGVRAPEVPVRPEGNRVRPVGRGDASLLP